MLDFWQDYPEIKEKLIAVQTMMTERLAVNNTDIRDALQKFTTRGGKWFGQRFFFYFLA